MKCRNEIPVNVMKKMRENASDIARKTGAMVGGAAKTLLGVFEVNTEASTAQMLGSYQCQQAMKISRTVNGRD